MKILAGLIVLVVLVAISYSVFKGFPIGYNQGHLIIYKYTCADICPDQGYWYKKYYGNISYDECEDRWPTRHGWLYG